MPVEQLLVEADKSWLDPRSPPLGERNVPFVTVRARWLELSIAPHHYGATLAELMGWWMRQRAPERPITPARRSSTLAGSATVL